MRLQEQMGRHVLDTVEERGWPWLPAPAILALSSSEVHVWVASLDQPVACLQAMRRTLAADEVDRAERFVSTKDRDRFITARGLLRMILGRYLGQPPERLRFCYGPHGKPTLEPGSGGGGIQFNLSHCCDLAMLAVARNRRVGIDVECIRPLPEASQLAERFFSTQEHLAFRCLPEVERQSAFFRCWTRKEAFIKAKGGGLALPLDGFDVSLAHDEPARLLAVKENPEEAMRWSLFELWPAPGCVATLATEGHGWRLRCWQWAEQSPLQKSQLS